MAQRSQTACRTSATSSSNAAIRPKCTSAGNGQAPSRCRACACPNVRIRKASREVGAFLVQQLRAEHRCYDMTAQIHTKTSYNVKHAHATKRKEKIHKSRNELPVLACTGKTFQYERHLIDTQFESAIVELLCAGERRHRRRATHRRTFRQSVERRDSPYAGRWP